MHQTFGLRDALTKTARYYAGGICESLASISGSCSSPICGSSWNRNECDVHHRTDVLRDLDGNIRRRRNLGPRRPLQDLTRLTCQDLPVLLEVRPQR